MADIICIGERVGVYMRLLSTIDILPPARRTEGMRYVVYTTSDFCPTPFNHCQFASYQPAKSYYQKTLSQIKTVLEDLNG